jgi:hypothetical protein
MKQTQSTQANPTKQQPGSADSPASKRTLQRTPVTPGEPAWARYTHSRLKLFGGHIR